MTRNLRMALLGMGSVAAVAAPVALAVSCGSGDQINDPNTLDVGMEVDYAPYNFAITNELYNTIHAQAESTTDITTDNGLTHEQAVAYMQMIAPVQGGGWAGGYDVFWANKMAHELGQPVLIHAIASAGLTPSLFDRHEVDINIAGSSWNEMRQERGQVSHPYFMPNNVLLYRKDAMTRDQAIAKIQTGSAHIAAQKGTTWVGIADALTSQSVIESDTETLAELELAKTNGTKADFVVTENTRWQTLDAMNDDYEMLITSDLGTVANVEHPTLDPETDRICMILPKETNLNLTQINTIIDNFTGATQTIDGQPHSPIDYTQNAPTINWTMSGETAQQNIQPQLNNAAALAVYANKV